ncbi:MAG: hypothetical protein Q7R73_05460 [bacterium]|nr:hypothetical protein [bacterium]
MTCATCKGSKTVILSAEKSPLGVAIEVDCPGCKGTGETGNPNACPTCNGSKNSVANIGGILFEVDCPDCSAKTVIG